MVLEQRPIPPRSMKVFATIYMQVYDKWERVEYMQDQYGRKWTSSSVVDAPRLLPGSQLRDEEMVEVEGESTG